MSRIEINLHPGMNNFRAAVRALSRSTIRRENGCTIITLEIGNETVVIRLPPLKRDS